MNSLFRVLGAMRKRTSQQSAGPGLAEAQRRRRPVALHGAAARQPPNPLDNRLSSAAHIWMNHLFRRFRPDILAAAHPRVVNKLALCWSDPVLADTVLKDLLMDKRGGRRGFPRVIAGELENLCELNARRLNEKAEEEDVWAPSRQATSDR